jgi:predicted phosphoribosyltransferase
MLFQDREDAAYKLAVKLQNYKGQNPLILAVPRGGVPMGYILAKELQGDLDVVLVHKLSHPMSPEFAIGAVDENGNIQIDTMETSFEGSREYLELEKTMQLERLKKRRQTYTPGRPSIDVKGRIVIIVDDGIATGWTIKAAIEAIRRKAPKKIIVATSVASLSSAEKIKHLADELICLAIPPYFMAVGQFYNNFTQVSDDDVIKLLEPTT